MKGSLICCWAPNIMYGYCSLCPLQCHSCSLSIADPASDMSSTSSTFHLWFYLSAIWISALGSGYHAMAMHQQSSAYEAQCTITTLLDLASYCPTSVMGVSDICRDHDQLSSLPSPNPWVSGDSREEAKVFSFTRQLRWDANEMTKVFFTGQHRPTSEQRQTLYSVQELSNCPTQTCCFTPTLQLGRLYMEHDMDFASDDNRWKKICYSYEIPLRNQ